MSESASTQRSALLIMDVQQGIVERYAEGDAYVRRLSDVLAAARSAGIRVIYVTIRFREGYPEISSRNRSFSTMKQNGRFQMTDPATQVHPAIAPEPGEVVVTKLRVGAFTGSDLEVILRAGNIDTLVLTGIATSGVVLSTVRAAADMDYRLIVLSDCCADLDEEVHRVLTEKVFPRQADVMTAQEWMAGLTGGA
ncbi:MAG TPA: isochorismatase family cysteine hydrolase [Chloroflexota bacterium]